VEDGEVVGIDRRREGDLEIRLLIDSEPAMALKAMAT
jgi:hypothetical protein